MSLRRDRAAGGLEFILKPADHERYEDELA